jgi:hypothetical protein
MNLSGFMKLTKTKPLDGRVSLETALISANCSPHPVSCASVVSRHPLNYPQL